MKQYLLCLISVLCVVGTLYSQETNLSVFHSSSGKDRKWISFKSNHEALYRVIQDEAFQHLSQREKEVEKLNSQADWIAYQKKKKEVICAPLAKFSKTPLNPRITGTLERETFTVEKIVFESHPGFYVTSCMFLPKKRQNPAPVVIYCSGHSDLGFRGDVYQRVMINLVEKGFIVFAFDPLGQGERMQYMDKETGKSKIGGPTREHSYAGVQTLMAGSSLSDYFIWDGVRVLDYLETRKEVDMKRIGITGRSGGGTQSALISACDDRIYASAPECYITNFTRLLQSIGPQDAEQNPYKAIVQGFDHPDFIHIRAPKPTLIVTTTHDFFSQQGARETYREAGKSYKALGKSENLQMAEDLGVHESTRKNRETVYAFFQKHLSLPGDPSDQEIVPFKVEELWVTPTGQIASSLGGENVYGLNKKYFRKQNFSRKDLPARVQDIAGIRFDNNLTTAVYTGKITGEGYQVEKYFLENEKGIYVLPVYVANKNNADINRIVVWQHAKGKAALLDDPMFKSLLDEGYTIVSADLPGTGELHDPAFSGDGIIQGIAFNYTFGANLAGKSIPGIQAEAFDLVMQFLNQDLRFRNKEMFAIAGGTAVSSMLHYTALRNPFRKVVLNSRLHPDGQLIQEEYYDPGEAFYITPGSLPCYDTDQLAGLLPAGSVLRSDSKNDNSSAVIQFLRK